MLVAHSHSKKAIIQSMKKNYTCHINTVSGRILILEHIGIKKQYKQDQKMVSKNLKWNIPEIAHLTPTPMTPNAISTATL